MVKVKIDTKDGAKTVKNDDEIVVKSIVKFLKNRGFDVRREKLSRGDSFRVKSGECSFKDKKLLFIDTRLPAEQQMSILTDYLVASELKFTEEELDTLPPSVRAVVQR